MKSRLKVFCQIKFLTKLSFVCIFNIIASKCKKIVQVIKTYMSQRTFLVQSHLAEFNLCNN